MISPEAVALFLIMFIWQIPHFLAIATLYRDDYRAGGFKMLPCIETDLQSTSRQIILYCMALIPVSLVPGITGLAGWVYLVAAVVMGIVGAFGDGTARRMVIAFAACAVAAFVITRLTLSKGEGTRMVSVSAE